MTKERARTTTAKEELRHTASDRQDDSNVRGEHRYPDAHQRPAERLARQDRDDLKERMSRRKPSR
jgi:hypothetical protein